MADFRSDTVTRPTAAMKVAMNSAEVGDDVFRDDPTVNALQQEAAAMLGFDAALFAPSGTQSNLIGLMAQCQRGDEILVGQQAHTYRMEGGGMAVLGSIQPQPIPNEPDGTLSISMLRAAVKPDDPHFARTRMLALENTFQGQVLPTAYLDEARRFVREADLRLHLDGARLFNAAVVGAMAAASGPPTASAVIDAARQLCSGFDTVSICLSKGLGCPVGSLILGSHDTIRHGLRIRKMLGGGMRQAGSLAAAGRYALGHHLARLADDHRRAAALANGLAEIAGNRAELVGRVAVMPTPTNMVFVEVAAEIARPLAQHLTDHGLRFIRSTAPDGSVRQRWVTHLDIDDGDVESALEGWSSFRL